MGIFLLQKHREKILNTPAVRENDPAIGCRADYEKKNIQERNLRKKQLEPRNTNRESMESIIYPETKWNGAARREPGHRQPKTSPKGVGPKLQIYAGRAIMKHADRIAWGKARPHDGFAAPISELFLASSHAIWRSYG